MEQPKGHGIWWLIPGTALFLALLSGLAEASDATKVLIGYGVVFVVFVVPVVAIYKAIQSAQNSGSKGQQPPR